MTDILKLFVVEYSMFQNATHVSTVGRMVRNNREGVMRGETNDYRPIGLFPTRAEADQFIVAFQPTLDKQAQVEFKSRNWRHIADVLLMLLPEDLNSRDGDK
jgi:hypothetical protein